MRIGFVGYGRFGRALGSMFEEYGYGVEAYDSADPSSRLEKAIADAQILFVAVPVAAMSKTFAHLAPLLEPGQVVVDVGSVKLAPSLEMARIFGDRQPWVASHPLFGPVSLARAEPNLRAVVCPNPMHPDAVALVESLYRSIGCSIVRLDSETHDRIMAQTHALAFFIAKGMLDAEVPTDSPAAPPSFQAMARTIESVRADAGHLLTTLHRENPFAPEYRRRLLTILQRLDDGLNQTDSTPSEAGDLSISPLPNPPELTQVRDRIDEVDSEIVQLLHRRADLVRRAQSAKAAVGRGVVDPDRERQMLDARSSWADATGLDSDGVRRIFEAIIDLSCDIQVRNA